MARHLVLAGAGHCHLELLANLQDYVRRGCTVTLISPGIFWYSGMGPGVLSEIYASAEHRVDTAGLVRRNGGTFIQDTVCQIDPLAQTVQLESGRTVAYDLLSINVGSQVPTSTIEGADENGWTVKPIANLTRLHDAIRTKASAGKQMRAVVAGGGPAGCEVALNLWHLIDRCGALPDIRVITPDSVPMKRVGAAPAEHVAREMTRLGIVVMSQLRVIRASRDKVYLDDQSELANDFFIVATGVRPPSLFRDSKLPTAADGSLLVNRHLQSMASARIFGAGDCIGFREGPPPRVGVYAVRESKLLRHNLCAWLDGKRPRCFKTGKPYLLILNMGDGTGLLFWKGHAWRGRWAFRLKDFLDRRFVEKDRRSKLPHQTPNERNPGIGFNRSGRH